MKQTVLVVEDDEAIRTVVQLALEDAGYRVLAATHGAAALELTAHVLPDVILLDMKMPVMDGWEFARRYQQHGTQSAPIIVFSAAPDILKRANSIAAADYIAKPFDIDTLLATICRHVDTPPARE